jgi:serine/threonine-protein kinase RsbW
VPEPALRTPELRLPELRLDFQADPVSVHQSLAQMLDLPPLSGLSQDDRSVAELVLAEVLNNVAEHAYGPGGGRVTVTLTGDPTGVRCLVADKGRAMPGERLPEGRLPGGPGTAVADLPEGGFGWHLIRSLSVGLTYARVDGQNQLGFFLPHGGVDLAGQGGQG